MLLERSRRSQGAMASLVAVMTVAILAVMVSARSGSAAPQPPPPPIPSLSLESLFHGSVSLVPLVPWQIVVPGGYAVLLQEISSRDALTPRVDVLVDGVAQRRWELETTRIPGEFPVIAREFETLTLVSYTTSPGQATADLNLTATLIPMADLLVQQAGRPTSVGFGSVPLNWSISRYFDGSLLNWDYAPSPGFALVVYELEPMYRDLDLLIDGTLVRRIAGAGPSASPDKRSRINGDRPLVAREGETLSVVPTTFDSDNGPLFNLYAALVPMSVLSN
ncbi:MAG: hypothetical protein R3F20_06535 [Planctomycetota bacterium]